MRALLDAMPDLLLRVYRDGTFLNAGAAEAFAQEIAHDAAVPTLSAMLPQAIATQLIEAINRSLDQGIVQHCTYSLLINDKMHVYEARVVASGNNEAVLIVRNITAQQEAETLLEQERAFLARRVEERTAELSAANAALARAARLKDEFLASMSHELRTPLNAVLGLSEALQEEVYGPICEAQARALRSIEESGRHLLTLINDILELSKIEAGKLELQIDQIDISTACQVSLRSIEQAARKKRLRVITSFDGRVTIVRADERRLKQMLMNLLSNAVKFTPEEGTIGLEITTDTEREVVHCSVWDTGIGVADDDLRRLFQPFMQLDSSLSRQYAGSGLGLALVYRMAELHGGSVSVTSKVGEGSRFTISLPWSPVQSEQAAQTKRWERELEANIRLPRRVLLIEDSPHAADQITRYLHELGVEVFMTDRGDSAVEQASELLPDAIILDIQLPDGSGWNVLTRLKDNPATKAIPVLINSVVDDPEHAQRLGAAAYLVKPISRHQLQRTLRLVTSHGDDRLLVTPPDMQVEAISMSPASEPLPSAPHPTKPLLLLAEDNELNILTMTDYLQASGYAVVVARTGQEALDLARSSNPSMILMDIQLPGIDGLEVIRRLRAQPATAYLPIIALTALAMPGDRERCIAGGANEYFSKPVSLNALVAAIDYLRQQRSSMESGRDNKS